MKLRFVHKIFLLILIPMLLLSLILGQRILGQIGTSNRLERLEQYAELSTRNSTLVHELQKERGATSGWLGSNDGTFADKLRQQRQTTNRVLQQWNDYRTGLEVDDALIQSTLSRIQQQLSRLQQVRTKVDARNIPLGDALGYYTGLNRDLLSVAAEISRISNSVELSRIASAFFSFLQAKERAGIERAVLSNTFAGDQFAPGLYARFLTLVSEQDTYLSQFAVSAPDALEEQWASLTSRPAFNEVSRLRAIARDNAQAGGFNVSGPDWFEKATARINLMKEMENEIADALLNQANNDHETAWRSVWLQLALLIGTLLFIGLCSFWITRTVQRQVASLGATMDRVRKEHDLSARADVLTGDELGDVARALNHTLEGFASAIKEVTVASRQLSEEARNTQNTVRETHASLNAQNTETMQVSAAIEEVSTAIADVANSTSNASDAARSANDLAADGHRRMQQAFSAISKLGEDISRVGEMTQQLKVSSGTISEVIDVINAISEQTNLLALNAAIEAARAGEQGRGFSVVADEVRTLAQRTHDSTAKVEQIIKKLQDQTDEASSLMEENQRDMDSTTEQIREVGEALDQIVNAVENITSLSTQIAAAAEEESTAMNDIGRSIATIDSSAERISDHARDLSDHAEQQAQMAEQLEQLISRFRLERPPKT